MASRFLDHNASTSAWQDTSCCWFFVTLPQLNFHDTIHRGCAYEKVVIKFYFNFGEGKLF